MLPGGWITRRLPTATRIVQGSPIERASTGHPVADAAAARSGALKWLSAFPPASLQLSRENGRGVCREVWPTMSRPLSYRTRPASNPTDWWSFATSARQSQLNQKQLSGAMKGTVRPPCFFTDAEARQRSGSFGFRVSQIDVRHLGDYPELPRRERWSDRVF
jgi:hypothetical protein